MEKLLVASGNLHKVGEIKEILKGKVQQILSLDDLKERPLEPEEDGVTFKENAQIKAEAYLPYFDDWILADDSGIVVPGLNGEPGIYSARYAGIKASDLENRNKLIQKLKDSGQDKMEAYFNCSLCLMKTGQLEPLFFEASWYGYVVTEESGKNGFGYDPMFVLEDGRSAAELEDCEKNELSHRGQALKKLKDYLA